MAKGKHKSESVHEADPILLLMKEHEEGMKYLKRLEGAAENMNIHGFSFEEFNNVDEAIRFIDTEIRHHNEKEEKYLFPLMERHINGPVEAMRDEHRELWRSFNSLRVCIKEVEEMKIYATTVRDLIQYSKAIVELLSNHIQKENDVLFPMVKKVLTSNEYKQLAKEIAGTTSAQTNTAIP